MAKNRVAPDTPKPKDNFSDRSQSKFKSKTKIGQIKQKLNIPNFQNRNQHTSEERYNKPNSSGSGFFVKPNNRVTKAVSEKTKTKNINTDQLKSDKKPFDKKKYRLKKYSNKYKLQQWEDKRNKAVLRGYYRNLKEDERKLDVKQIYEEHESESNDENEDVDDKIHEQNENNLNTSIIQNTRKDSSISEENVIVPKNSKGKKNKAFKKAHLEFQRIKEEKQKKYEELLKKKTEKKEALQEYKRKKVEKYKKLSRKTKRGQPIMKDRIEMLLEKIQNSV